ncbi:MAG: 5-bromo-4-chloroindolyl phosphate hydrolysis family protein [Oscillospiraceae bacterium]|jgi:hypothetical protein|nr:5-bromo-4-chloroindolyl phosphate hydrolysis family protein [Oscillospiraceae bacterium]
MSQFPLKKPGAYHGDVALGVLSIITAVASMITLPIVGGLSGFPGLFGSIGGMFLLSGVITGACIHNTVCTLGRASRYTKIRNVIGNNGRFKVEALSNATGITQKDLTRSFDEMRRLGYFDFAEINAEDKEFVFNPNSPRLIGGEFPSVFTVYKAHRASRFWNWAFPLSVVGLCIIFGAPHDMAVAGAIFTGATALVTWRSSPFAKYYTETIVAEPPPIMLTSNTGTNAAQTEADILLEQMNLYYTDLLKHSIDIQSQKIRPVLREIVAVVGEIIRYVKEHPEKYLSVRDFAGYYLPTACKLFGTYRELSLKPEKGVNIITAMEKIEQSAPQILSTCRREYDELFNDKAMDIQAEISVMQSMMKTDDGGFNPFEEFDDATPKLQ